MIQSSDNIEQIEFIKNAFNPNLIKYDVSNVKNHMEKFVEAIHEKYPIKQSPQQKN